MFKDVAFLIKKNKVTDDAGDPVETEIEQMVFCNEKSVGQSEFYQAMASGLKPEIKLEIMSFEYDNQKQIRYKDRVYDVIRTYVKDSADIIELTLGGGINGAT